MKAFVPEPTYRRKKKKRPYGRIILLIVLAGILYSSYVYGPMVCIMLAKDPVSQIKERAQNFEKRLQEGNTPVPDLHADVIQGRRFLTLLEGSEPAKAHVHYYRGLFDFYDLLLRVPLNARSLLDLSGRGKLPGQLEYQDMEATDIPALGARMAGRMRKALAIDPNLPEANMARMILLYGDFFAHARVDPVFLEIINGIDEAGVSNALLPYYDWLALTFYSFLKDEKSLARIADRLRGIDEKGKAEADGKGGDKSGGPDPKSGAAGKDDPTAKGPDAVTPATPAVRRAGIALTPGELDLVLCYGAFNAKNYLRSLTLARSIKSREDLPTFLRVEALRMEGEIFLRQRGPGAALPYFREALSKAGGADEYIQRVIRRLTDS